MRGTNESGVALISTILVLALTSALIVGFVVLVISDQQGGFANRNQSEAYAAAHAGLEQLTNDLGDLFSVNYAPTGAQIQGLTAGPPPMTGITFQSPDGSSGYTVAFTPDANGNPQPEPNPRTITSGPYQGFLGLITPYEITVTARTTYGSEVRMRRTMQTVAIPVFQFGIFSENDLSFFAGPNFNFGGRVHSNSHVYVAEGDGATLTLADRVTAWGEIVRTHLANGYVITASGHTGTVNQARAPGNFVPLRYTGPNQGSVNVVDATQLPLANPTLGPDPPAVPAGTTANEPTWTNVSVGTYNSYIRNGRTGARRLVLPIVQLLGGDPRNNIEIIRRPLVNSNEDVNNPTVFGQRYFSMASLRILLSDTPADIQSLPTVTGAAPVDLANIAAAGYVVDGAHPPMALSSNVPADGYRTPANTPIIDGFIKIERQDPAGAWHDVTMEILNLGFTGRNLANNHTVNVPGSTCAAVVPNPDSIIRFQRVRDRPVDLNVPVANTWACGRNAAGAFSTNPYDYWPNVIYDEREGARRDAENTATTTVYLGGAMYYVELDINNLRRWLDGAIGVTGTDTMDVTGYVVYFSDRRGNQRDLAGLETGEYGWEDIINSDSVSTPNGVLDRGEDMNANGLLEVYGNMPMLQAGSTAPLDITARVTTAVAATIPRANRPVFFRRALKVVSGQRGNLPAVGNQGVSVVAENPVYVQGNFNADAGGFGPTGDGHVSSAVMGDSVTLLSNNWNDLTSFRFPHNADQRNATQTWYRTAIVAGKGLTFPRPGNPGGPALNAGDHTDFGTDGGAHNFIRYIEDWSGQTLWYRGSIVSFYTSRQAVGTYKCCDNVYKPPTRGYNFDVEFLTPALLPPRTPMFRDINTLTFRQILRPTQ